MDVSPTDEFFGFTHRPFRAAPDPRDYVEVEIVEQELERLSASACQGDGIAVLTAGPGAGKTLVCEQLRSRLQEQFEAVVLSSSGFATRRALLQSVLFSLGESYEGLSEQELRLNVLNFARVLGARREGIVLIVDEAHLLNTRLLEELRCLTNHSEGGRPLIRVILCGQLSLEDALVDPALEAFNYRISCHCTLEPLSMQDSARLVGGRLRQAGRPVEEILTPEALETICRVSDGVPRCLVQLCDQSLKIAASRTESPVQEESVRVALKRLKQLPLQWNESAIDQPVSDECELNDDVPRHGIEAPPTDDQPIADWSDSVSCVEVGTESETQVSTGGAETHTGEMTSWHAYETDVEISHASAAADKPEAARQIVESQSAQQSVSVEIGSKLEDDASTQRGGSNTSAADVARPSDSFAVTPVDDAYAQLDNLKAPAFPICDSECLDHQLQSKVRQGSTRRPPVAEDVVDAHQPYSDRTTDPAQRIEEVIAALSVISGESTGSCSGQFSNDDVAWQATGDCREYDVVEPGGVPLWDAIERSTDQQTPTITAATQSTHAPGHESGAGTTAGQSPTRRPYARLFSRVRKQHI